MTVVWYFDHSFSVKITRFWKYIRVKLYITRTHMVHYLCPPPRPKPPIRNILQTAKKSDILDREHNLPHLTLNVICSSGCDAKQEKQRWSRKPRKRTSATFVSKIAFIRVCQKTGNVFLQWCYPFLHWISCFFKKTERIELKNCNCE